VPSSLQLVNRVLGEDHSIVELALQVKNKRQFHQDVKIQRTKHIVFSMYLALNEANCSDENRQNLPP
jgi:hypothetical protein